jgi:hypothetical protein
LAAHGSIIFLALHCPETSLRVVDGGRFYLVFPPVERIFRLIFGAGM